MGGSVRKQGGHLVARARTFLSDYNPMGKAFPYMVVNEDGTASMGNIYAHSVVDARKRLMENASVKQVTLLDYKVR